MKTNLTYKKATEELEIIVADIEEGNVPIDGLIGKIKRANELILFCQGKLRDTETEVNTILPKRR